MLLGGGGGKLGKVHGFALSALRLALIFSCMAGEQQRGVMKQHLCFQFEQSSSRSSSSSIVSFPYVNSSPARDRCWGTRGLACETASSTAPRSSLFDRLRCGLSENNEKNNGLTLRIIGIILGIIE